MLQNVFLFMSIILSMIKGEVDVPPTFTRSLKDTYLTQLNEIKLSCHCRGLPTPGMIFVK